jgi:hypothetical protein
MDDDIPKFSIRSFKRDSRLASLFFDEFYL